MVPSHRQYRRAHLAARRDARPAGVACALILLFCVYVGYTYLPTITTSSTSVSTRSDGVTPLKVSLDPVVSVRAAGYGANYCDGPNPSNFLGSTHRAWLVLLLPAVVFLFIGLAIVTDDFFVPALERICEQLALSEDVAGATFMAAGSSAPELFTALLGALWSKDDVGIGTIVGSAVFNILIIIGLSAALAKDTLELDFRPLLRDSVFYVISIIMLIVFVMFVGGHPDPVTGEYKIAGMVNWWEGLVFVLAYVVYILFMAYGNKPYLKWTERFVKSSHLQTTEDVDVERAVSNETLDSTPSAPTAPKMSEPASPVDPSLQSALERHSSKYFERNPRSHMRVLTYAVMAAQRFEHVSPEDVEGMPNHIADAVPDQDASMDNVQRTAQMSAQQSQAQSQDPPQVPMILLGTTKKPKSKYGWVVLPLVVPWNLLYRFTIIDCSKDRRKRLWPVTFAISIVWIMIISFAMVEATRLSGCFIGIPSAVMGLTFLAAGSSVPDALASIAVAKNGLGDMVVSNAIGSNVFDIFLGLGLPWFIAGLALEEGVSTVTVDPPTLIIGPIAVLFAVIVILVLLLMWMKWRLSRMLGYALFGLYGLFIVFSLLNAFVFAR